MSPIVEMLLAFLAEMLKNCPEPAPTKVGWLRKPKLFHRALLFIKAKANGMSGADFRSGMAELNAMQAEASDADLLEFVTTCCAA